MVLPKSGQGSSTSVPMGGEASESVEKAEEEDEEEDEKAEEESEEEDESSSNAERVSPSSQNEPAHSSAPPSVSDVDASESGERPPPPWPGKSSELA